MKLLEGQTDVNRESRLTKLWLIILFITFFILPIFLFLHFHPQRAFDYVFGPGDSFTQYFPSHHWIKTFPLWNDLIKSGNPDAADPQSQAFYPLALLFARFLPQPLAFNTFVFLHYVLAGVLMFLFLRKLRISVYSSMIASLVFVYSGFLMSHKGHVTIVNAAIWLPLILLGILQFSQTFDIRQLLLSGSGLALSILAGHPQITLYQAMVAAGYTVFLFVTKKKPRILAALSVPVIGMIFAAVQVLPTIEAFQLCTRETINYDFFSSYSFALSDLPLLFFPTLYGSANWPADFTFQGGATELTGYIGILPLILAFSGFLLLRKKNKEIAFWAAIAAIGFLLTLGRSTPFYRLMYHVPIYDLFRVPARNWYEVHFAVSVLCAYALDAFFVHGLNENRAALKVLRVSAFSILSLAFLLWLTVRYFSRNQDFVTNILSISRPSLFLENLDFFSLSVCVPLAIMSISCLATCFLPVIQKHTILKFFLALFVLLDLWSFGFFFGLTFIPTKLWQQESDVLRFLKTREDNFDSFRIFSIPSDKLLYTGFEPNLNMIHGIPLINGYGPIVLRNYRSLTALNAAGTALQDSLNDLLETNTAISLLSTKYIVTSSPEAARILIKRKDLYHVLYKDKDGIVLFSNERFLPRARFVHAIFAVEGSQDSIADLVKQDPKPERTALVEMKERRQAYLSAGVVTSAHYTPRLIQLSVQTRGKAFLILSDVFYPGWVGRVDGKPTTIYQTDACLRGILIANRGFHSVSFEYRPRSIFYGLLISSLSIFLALCVSIVSTFRHRQNR